MGPLFADVLKIIFLLSLAMSTTTTTNANKATDKLFSCICKKAKWHKTCHILLRIDRKTRSASSLRFLGLGTMDMALFQAKSSLDSFNKLLIKNKRKNLGQKEKYVYCRNSYELALTQLREAQTFVGIKSDFRSARKILEQVCKVPDSCLKELGAPENDVSRESVMSDVIFDIAFVVVKELESGKNSTCFV